MTRVGRVRHALVDLGGDLLDRARTLREKVDDLCTSAAGQCFRDGAEGVE
jgi:hypothetical protein